MRPQRNSTILVHSLSIGLEGTDDPFGERRHRRLNSIEGAHDRLFARVNIPGGHGNRGVARYSGQSPSIASCFTQPGEEGIPRFAPILTDVFLSCQP